MLQSSPGYCSSKSALGNSLDDYCHNSSITPKPSTFCLGACTIVRASLVGSSVYHTSPLRVRNAPPAYMTWMADGEVSLYFGQLSLDSPRWVADPCNRAEMRIRSSWSDEVTIQWRIDRMSVWWTIDMQLVVLLKGWYKNTRPSPTSVQPLRGTCKRGCTLPKQVLLPCRHLPHAPSQSPCWEPSSKAFPPPKPLQDTF